METANKNPFLIDDTNETSTQEESNFNPFFTAGDSELANNSFNPFLSAAPEDNYSTANTANNPFASFFDIQPDPPTNKDGENTFDIFGAPNEVTKPAFDLLSDFADNTFEAPKTETVQNLELFQLGRRESQSEGNDSSRPPRPEPPRRPPPPKPNPPSRDTKDLILTVTGALEATSTDLLDRLQATRTPSPIPMKDLVSPSPTNFEEVHDLFNEPAKIQEPVVKPPSPTPQEEYNVFEAIANLPKGDEIKPQVTAPPSRPPPPPIPTKPEIIHPLVSPTEFDMTDAFEDPIFTSNTQVEQPRMMSPELKTSPISTPVVPNLFEDDLISPSQLQSETIPNETKLSPETFKDKLGVGYVPSRKASHDVSSDRIQVIPSRKKYSLDYTYSQSLPKNVAGLTDNAILEIPKFSIMSTTPILSAEDITDESIMDEKSEPNLIFDMQPTIAHPSPQDIQQPSPFPVVEPTSQDDAFDEFSAKFDSVSTALSKSENADPFDPFGSGVQVASTSQDGFSSEAGFGNEDTFDDFLSLSAPPPVDDLTPQQQTSSDWGETADGAYSAGRFNPFDKMPAQPIDDDSFQLVFEPAREKTSRSESQETPQTPLFDEDVSQPLEPFPRTEYHGTGWEMQIRYPIRKKFTGQRFWKKVFVKLVYQGDTPHLELVNKDDSKETLLHEWPLQPCYAISDIGAQQYDQYGKIFTVKIQFVIYKERPGVRPGQVTKAERLSNKLSQFAAYAIQGDYQGVKEFGSDLKKLGLPVEHSPQMSLICKLGSHNYEDMKQFSACVEEALYRLPAHRDNIHINYKMEEVQITAVDELYVEQSSGGIVTKQIARVRLFFLGFLTGMPDVDLGVNDLWRQGKEVVGRHDIIPVVTEEWIRLENVEFHSCIQQDVYEETRTIRFKPPDACYLELMRFRVRPPKNRELPLQLRTTFRITGNKVDILSDILVPGFTSRKLGQIPCEDVAVRIPIPECWIYLFRVEKHFRYGSVKSAHRRTGKIKGIERLLGTVDTLEPHLIEVTSGHAKYEHHHRSIVWRMPRLPKEGQGAYTTHNLICHLALTSYDQIPDELAKYCYVEFTMPITQVSHTTVRSVSISNSDSDTPPEKYVRHLARHEYRVEIEHTHSESTNEYAISAAVNKPMPPPSPALHEQRPPSVTHTESDTDSD